MKCFVIPSSTTGVAKYLNFSKKIMHEKTGKPEEYDTKCLWEDVKADTIMEEVYPNIRVLLRLLMLFPLSAAVVERLFSKLKIVKNRLRNRLGDLTLSKLLTVCTESPKDGFSDQDYERMVDQLKLNNPAMRARDLL